MRNSRLGEAGFIEPSKVIQYWKTFPAGTEAPNQLWYLYVRETWFRQQQSGPAGN